MQRLLISRWPMLAIVLATVPFSAPTGRSAFAICFSVVALQIGLHLFDADRFARWLERGWLLLLDAATVGLAMLGARALEAPGFVALFTVVLAASWTTDRAKTLLAATAVVFAYLGWATGVPATAASPLALWVAAPLTVAAGWSFGTLASRFADAPRERRDAPVAGTENWALLGIAEAIGSSLDIQEVIRSIVRRVGESMQTDSCSILLSDSRLDHCFVVASTGNPDVDMLAVDLDNYPEVRHAIDTREPVVIDDVENHPLVAQDVREFLLDKGYRSLLVVPLLFGREVIGALFIRGRAGRPFTAEELHFCKVAAGISANALQNAVLYREMKQESERHRETGEKLRRVLDGSPDVIIACDEENRITEFNIGAGRLFEMRPERAVGRSVTDVLGSAAATFEGVAADPEADPRDVVVVRDDGQRAEISLAGAALCGPDGRPAGRVWIGRDVTKLRRVEKSLAQAERLSSLGEVVAGVAHELNNPLAGVMGYAELLRAGECEPNQLRDLERIVESAQRCQKIVLKLLSFARKHPPEKKLHSLNECLERVLDLKDYHLRSSQIETTLDLDPELPATSFDFHQIEQVVLNLLNNAEHAIRRTKSAGRIVLRSGAGERTVWFEVEDNGPGIPPAVRDRVFDPFFTTKEVGQGTGLGLSVSFGIVREHDGRIELAESGESGSRFRVELPVVQESADEPPRREPQGAGDDAAPALDGCRVLVVEDEPGLLDIYDRVLRAAGAHATLARDGEEAWRHLEEADFAFDLIVTDLLMPKLNGRQLYERVAERHPEMVSRFVFTTGDLARDDTIEFLEQLPNRILAKPLQVETVTRVLSQAAATTLR